MATDKTPQQRRMERAEESANKWKIKSIERREEIERLNLRMKGLDDKISKIDEIKDKITDQNKQIESLKHELQQAQLMITKQHSQIEELKKKTVLRRSKAL